MRILLIDDNYDDRLLITHALEREFPEVEFLEVYREQDFEQALFSKQFDLVITDYELRWTDGLTVVQKLKNMYPECPVIMFTDSGTQEVAVEAMKLGLDDYILKSATHYIRLPAAVKSALDKVEAQKKVVSLEVRLQTLLNNLNVGVYRLSGNGVLLEANNAFLQLMGLSGTQFHQNEYTELLSKLLYSGEGDREIILRQQGDTVVWVKISQTIINIDGAIIIDGLMEDISEAKRRDAEREAAITELADAKEELKRLLGEACEANRIKDQFMAIVSHELRSPLTSILGWAKILRSKKLPEAQLAQGLETIERNAKLQNTLIEDILDISRIIQNRLNIQRRPIKIVPLITTVIEDVKPAAQAKSISIESSINPMVANVMADPERLLQIIRNLLNNAIKFTEQGGKVFIQLEQIDSSIYITVKDTGVGIGADFLPHVFEPFRQADTSVARAHKGLGLGLAIVSRLVEMHKGKVSVASEGIGKGATFTIELPVYIGQVASGQVVQTAEIEELPSLQGMHILVVDDDKDTRELIAHIVEGCSAKVTTTSSASEALQILSNSKPDILLSDIGMPEEDGYSLISKIRTLPGEVQQIPAIALTAFARVEDKKAAIAAGFQQHLVKPVNPLELVSTVLKVSR
ncbi:multi-sensor hybrid histidine kinase [Calothrix sp. NIES-4071]|nr:multi-sensor hybrid histidine kinase [Calothrix sp. NIES-4071]BAZ58030.1 multi-sensor hybrid histidine kinase [Calothrix sp. NIES-4105]